MNFIAWSIFARPSCWYGCSLDLFRFGFTVSKGTPQWFKREFANPITAGRDSTASLAAARLAEERTEEVMNSLAARSLTNWQLAALTKDLILRRTTKMLEQLLPPRSTIFFTTLSVANLL